MTIFRFKRLFPVVFMLGFAILACAGNMSDACKSDDAVAQVEIINMTPNMPEGSFTVINSLQPTFRWSINANAPCVPLGWWVTIAPLDDPGNPVITDKMDSVNNLEPTNPLPFFYTANDNLAPKTYYALTLKPMMDNSDLSALYARTFLFQTGPICTGSGGDALPVPQLLLPPSGTEENIGDGFIRLKWMTDSTCVWAYDYQLSVKSDFSQMDRAANLTGEMVNLKAFANYQPEGGETKIEECTTYYWRVRVNTPPQVGDWSGTSSFTTSQYNGEPCGQTNLPLSNVTIMVNLKMDSPCYSLPSTNSDVEEIFQGGMKVVLDGRNEDASWFEVLKPDSDLRCWLSALVLDSDQDLSKLPLITNLPTEHTPTFTLTINGPTFTNTPFPSLTITLKPTFTFTPKRTATRTITPTATPTFCSRFTDKTMCERSGVCYWWVNIYTHKGYCLQK